MSVEMLQQCPRLLEESLVICRHGYKSVQEAMRKVLSDSLNLQ